MSNTQFYFAIGVPFFTVLLVWIGSTIANRSAISDLRSEMRTGFEAVNRRLDGMESRFDRLEARFDRVDTEIRKDHEHRITMLEERVFTRLA